MKDMDDNLHVCPLKSSCPVLKMFFVITDISENEMRAINELPIGKLEDLGDKSPVGRRIHDLLTRFEVLRDVSFLEEAGRLMWQQIFEPHRSAEFFEYQKHSSPFTEPFQLAPRLPNLQPINVEKVISLVFDTPMLARNADLWTTTTAATPDRNLKPELWNDKGSSINSAALTMDDRSAQSMNAYQATKPNFPSTFSQPTTDSQNILDSMTKNPVTNSNQRYLTYYRASVNMGSHTPTEKALGKETCKKGDQVSAYGSEVLAFLNRESDLAELQARSRALVSRYLSPSTSESKAIDEFLAKIHGT
jgi:hypothetical protein